MTLGHAPLFHEHHALFHEPVASRSGPRRSPTLRRMTLALLALVAGLLAVLAGPTSGPFAVPAAAADYAIGGIITAEGEPVTGAIVHVTGPDGFTGDGTSEANGRWTVAVPGPGDYSVELDTGTLPSGSALREGTENPRKVTLGTTSSVNVLFPIGEDTRQTSGFGSQLLQRLASGLNFGLLIALASIGITLIFGTTGLNNFAHGELVTFGAVVTWLVAGQWGVNIFLTMVIALIAGGAFGWVQDALLWAPLRRRGMRLVPLMIVSIGFALLMRYLIVFFIGPDTKVLNVGLGDPVVLGSVRLTEGTLVSMAISAITLVAVAFFLSRTRLGKATRAVSDNAGLAAASGIDVDRIIRIVWVMAAGLSGLAGVMLGMYTQVSWDMGSQILLLMFAATTLGGIGSAYGALLGSIIIGFVVELSTLIIPADLKYAAALLILIVVMLVRPQGILGTRERIG